MSDWFRPSENTVWFGPVSSSHTSVERALPGPQPPESPAEQTTELVLFSTLRHRPLWDWIADQAPTEPEWPTVDLDTK